MKGYFMINNEIPKYRKKKHSSISKSNAKSKHKHEYAECLLIHNNRPYRATYCKICGKINSIHFFETKHTDSELLVIMNDDEIFEEYRNLEKIEVEDISQKYMPIS